jgi:DNA repair protein RadC
MNTDHEITAFHVREVEVKYKPAIDLPEPKRFHNSREIYHFLRHRMMSEPVEIFETIILDAKNCIICIDHISRGSLSTSCVHPREVFSNPVRLHAAAILMLHNHPSGDPAPSREDRDCTLRLCKAGQILGIRVLDHIVFGDNDYFSFADAGQLGFLEAANV